jgi:hypothetical protein
MRRILPCFVALIVLTSSARGQSCQGLSSFSTSPLQLTGEASLTGDSRAVGAGVAAGFPRGPFGQVAVANRTHENFGGSSIGVAAAAGYAVPLGSASRVHLCPVIGGMLEMGPNNAFGSGVERSRRSAQLGVAIGTELSPVRQWNIIPSAGLFYAFQRDQAEDAGGAVLFQIDDYYALAQLGVGLVFKSRLSLRPYVDLPLSLPSTEPTVGLTVGYSIGKP